MSDAPPNGRELLRATFALLRQDRQMIALPFVGMVFGIIAALLFFGPGYVIGWLANGQEGGKLAYYAGAALAGFGATIVAVFFQVALVIGANQRSDGGEPTTRSCLREAWKLRRKILGWSLLTATVGFVLHLIQERLGFLGFILNLFGGLAWGIATFVVMPVLVAEDVGPVTAVRRSTRVLRDTWGTSLRTAVRGSILAFGYWLVPLALLMVGCITTFSGLAVVGVPMMVVAAVALIALASLISAAGTYARALIYRYAVGLPTPDIDTAMLAEAFYPKVRSGIGGNGGSGGNSGNRRQQQVYGAGARDTLAGGIAAGWSVSPW